VTTRRERWVKATSGRCCDGGAKAAGETPEGVWKLKRGSGSERANPPFTRNGSLPGANPGAVACHAGQGRKRLRQDRGNGKREWAGEEPAQLGGGENPWRANPVRGSGMKQAHKACRRRKPSRVWETLWTEHRRARERAPVSGLRVLMSRRGNKPHGRCSPLGEPVGCREGL